MIDIITATSNKRGELLAYIKSRLSNDSYTWARNLVSDITKKIVTIKDDEFTIKAYPFYKNSKKFFEKVCTEVTPGGILLTLYLVAIELGIRDVGDAVEKLPEFLEEIDMEDWSEMNYDAAVTFDLYVSACIINKRVGNENYEDNEIFAAGLHSLGLLDLIQVD